MAFYPALACTEAADLLDQGDDECKSAAARWNV
jgi:hypothetical protein